MSITRAGPSCRSAEVRKVLRQPRCALLDPAIYMPRPGTRLSEKGLGSTTNGAKDHSLARRYPPVLPRGSSDEGTLGRGRFAAPRRLPSTKSPSPPGFSAPVPPGFPRRCEIWAAMMVALYAAVFWGCSSEKVPQSALRHPVGHALFSPARRGCRPPTKRPRLPVPSPTNHRGCRLISVVAGFVSHRAASCLLIASRPWPGPSCGLRGR